MVFIVALTRDLEWLRRPILTTPRLTCGRLYITTGMQIRDKIVNTRPARNTPPAGVAV